MLIVTCMVCLTRYLNSAQKFPLEIYRPFTIRFFCLLTTSKQWHDKVSKAVPVSNRDSTFQNLLNSNKTVSSTPVRVTAPTVSSQRLPDCQYDSYLFNNLKMRFHWLHLFCLKITIFLVLESDNYNLLENMQS